MYLPIYRKNFKVFLPYDCINYISCNQHVSFYCYYILSSFYSLCLCCGITYVDFQKSGHGGSLLTIFSLLLLSCKMTFVFFNQPSDFCLCLHIPSLKDYWFYSSANLMCSSVSSNLSFFSLCWWFRHSGSVIAICINFDKMEKTHFIL